MIRRRPLLLAGVAGMVIGQWRRARAQSASPGLDRPGLVIALRHALAPGTDDPPGFVLGDCTTQRNLDARGRAQARSMGERLGDAGLAGVPVYSSRWCRCLETAELLGLGAVIPLPALDSFFGRPAEREPRTAALRAFLANEGPAGPPLVLVTHQVNITGITGRSTRSGEGVVLRRLADGGLEVLDLLPPPATG